MRQHMDEDGQHSGACCLNQQLTTVAVVLFQDPNHDATA